MFRYSSKWAIYQTFLSQFSISIILQDGDTNGKKINEIMGIKRIIQAHIRICVSARKTIIHLKMRKKKSRYQITNTMTSIFGFGLCISCYNGCHIIAYINIVKQNKKFIYRKTLSWKIITISLRHLYFSEILLGRGLTTVMITPKLIRTFSYSHTQYKLHYLIDITWFLMNEAK